LTSDPPKRDLDAQAEEALELARSMPGGPEKIEALKKAGLLRKARQRPRDFIRQTWTATKVAWVSCDG
jgi:hypothetical protein